MKENMSQIIAIARKYRVFVRNENEKVKIKG